VSGESADRVVADGLDPGRLDGLVSIGVDEVSLTITCISTASTTGISAW